MSTNKEKKDDSREQGIITEYNNLMDGFHSCSFFYNEPQLSYGKYIQLSAYEEKKFGVAVTVGDSSITLTK